MMKRRTETEKYDYDVVLRGSFSRPDTTRRNYEKKDIYIPPGVKVSGIRWRVRNRQHRGWCPLCVGTVTGDFEYSVTVSASSRDDALRKAKARLINKLKYYMCSPPDLQIR